jgi:hypothetical protein
VTWASEYNATSETFRGIYAQLYRANGVRVGGEFRVNALSNLTVSFPSATALTDGEVLLSWRQGGAQVAQRFTSNAVRLGPGFRISSLDFADRIASTMPSSLTAVRGGQFVVANTYRYDDGGDWLVRTDRFKAGRLLVSYPDYEVFVPSVVSSYSNGSRFVVVWEEAIDQRIAGRRYSP